VALMTPCVKFFRKREGVSSNTPGFPSWKNLKWHEKKKKKKGDQLLTTSEKQKSAKLIWPVQRVENDPERKGKKRRYRGYSHYPRGGKVQEYLPQTQPRGLGRRGKRKGRNYSLQFQLFGGKGGESKYSSVDGVKGMCRAIPNLGRRKRGKKGMGLCLLPIREGRKTRTVPITVQSDRRRVLRKPIEGRKKGKSVGDHISLSHVGSKKGRSRGVLDRERNTRRKFKERL